MAFWATGGRTARVCSRAPRRSGALSVHSLTLAPVSFRAAGHAQESRQLYRGRTCRQEAKEARVSACIGAVDLMQAACCELAAWRSGTGGPGDDSRSLNRAPQALVRPPVHHPPVLPRVPHHPVHAEGQGRPLQGARVNTGSTLARRRRLGFRRTGARPSACPPTRTPHACAANDASPLLRYATSTQVYESIMALAPSSNSPTMSNPSYSLQVNGLTDIYNWLTTILFPAWNDPSCGDISCILPYEFPSFGACFLKNPPLMSSSFAAGAPLRKFQTRQEKGPPSLVFPPMTPAEALLPARARPQATKGASRTAACSRT